MGKLPYKHVLICLSIFILFCLFYFNLNDKMSESILFLISPINSTAPDFSTKRFDKLIFPLHGDCGGLGNQLYKIAILYAIGLHPNVRRTPGMNFYNSCSKKYIKEFSETFPNVMRLVEFDVRFIDSIYKIRTFVGLGQ